MVSNHTKLMRLIDNLDSLKHNHGEWCDPNAYQALLNHMRAMAPKPRHDDCPDQPTHIEPTDEEIARYDAEPANYRGFIPHERQAYPHNAEGPVRRPDAPFIEQGRASAERPDIKGAAGRGFRHGLAQGHEREAAFNREYPVGGMVVKQANNLFWAVIGAFFFGG
ncbi:MAG: hypothetical protein O3A51_09610 [Verrucomicrobia bacterium]|nr:hypothetical protein [Verrucomicrobiota bacterium]